MIKPYIDRDSSLETHPVSLNVVSSEPEEILSRDLNDTLSPLATAKLSCLQCSVKILRIFSRSSSTCFQMCQRGTDAKRTSMMLLSTLIPGRDICKSSESFLRD